MNLFRSFKKVFIILFSIIIILVALSGVFSTNSMDKLAYVVALGLDIGESNVLKISIQLNKPSGGSSSSDSSGSQSSENVITSVEASSIESGINLFNSYLSKKVNLSHCKVIVVSEELATLGIADYIYSLINNIEVNSHASLIISKISAKDFLDNSKPILEQLSSKYYEVVPNSNKYTGYTEDVSLVHFFSDSIDSFKEPIAILGNINLGNGEDSNVTNSYKSGDTPISSNITVENMGLAVFKNNKLIGELNGLESICHSLVSNQLKSCVITIPNPIEDDKYLDLNLKLSNNSKNEVSFINGSPYISSKIKVDLKILSTTENSNSGSTNYFSKDNISIIEEACNQYLEKIILNYLYKTSRDFESDINGFGKSAVKYFATSNEWNSYNWLNNYKNSTFNVEIDSCLKSGYTFI